MIVVSRTLNIDTDAKAAEGFIAIYNLTPKLQEKALEVYMANGILTVFLIGSTASIGTIEFEPGLLLDFKKMWSRIVPKEVAYEHRYQWEENNAYSHVRASLMGASLVIPVVNKRLTLGQYQQVVLVEFDNRARKRQIVMQFMGEN